MYRRRKRRKLPLFLILCVFLGVFIAAAILMGVAFVMTKIDISKGLAKILSIAALLVGSYFGGYICAKKYRNNGLLRGAACGFLIFLLVLATGSVFAGEILALSSAARLLLVIVAGAVGGAAGVNSKRNRY